MKKCLLIISLICFMHSYRGYSQPQWKFHLAFEDATGAKDTVWFIWDVNAVSWGYDPLLGEAPVNINTNLFNVWVFNYNNDTTKTTAEPFTNTAIGNIIRGFNCQFPLTISWDSALFHAPWLPEPVDLAYMSSDYFFGHNNCPTCQAFNMLIDNHVTISEPWVNSDNFFPIYIDIMRGTTVNVAENKFSKRSISVYPNPASSIITIIAKEIKECALVDNTGRIVLNRSFYDDLDYTIPVNAIPQGFYNLKITNKNNEMHYEKIIVTH